LFALRLLINSRAIRHQFFSLPRVVISRKCLFSSLHAQCRKKRREILHHSVTANNDFKEHNKEEKGKGRGEKFSRISRTHFRIPYGNSAAAPSK
jgi:hypothetical protein